MYTFLRFLFLIYKLGFEKLLPVCGLSISVSFHCRVFKVSIRNQT